MKKTILLTALIAFCLTSFAQRPGEGDRSSRDKIKEWRTAFITEKLALTTAEAEKFWPLFNQKDNELKQVRKAIRQTDRQEVEGLTNEEAEKLILRHFSLREKELNIQIKYFEKLKTAIPAKKIAKLPLIEREFKRMLMQKIRGERRGE